MTYRNGSDEVDASRREVLVAAMLAWLAAQWMPVDVLAAPAMQEQGGAGSDLDTFIRLSEAVTGVQQLDRDMARKVLDLIRAEPWGKEHLGQIAAKILPNVTGNLTPLLRQQLLDPKRYTDGERWFIGHFLTTWFTGVYYHQRGNFVVDYRDALMHVALQDVRPIPGHCEGKFGFWSEPPPGAMK